MIGPKAVLLAISLAVFPALADGTLTESSNVREPQRWAVGFTLGSPTGLSFKRYLGGSNAFDIDLGFAYGPGLRLGVDYLWELAQLAPRSQSVNIDFYIGAGPFVGALSGPCGNFGSHQSCGNGDVYLGARMPIGLEAVFRRVPVSLGLEVAPALAFAPGSAGFLLDVNLAVRVLL